MLLLCYDKLYGEKKNEDDELTVGHLLGVVPFVATTLLTSCMMIGAYFIQREDLQKRADIIADTNRNGHIELEERLRMYEQIGTDHPSLHQLRDYIQNMERRK